MVLMDVNLIQKPIIQKWTFRFSYLWIELLYVGSWVCVLCCISCIKLHLGFDVTPEWIRCMMPVIFSLYSRSNIQTQNRVVMAMPTIISDLISKWITMRDVTRGWCLIDNVYIRQSTFDCMLTLFVAEIFTLHHSASDRKDRTHT